MNNIDTIVLGCTHFIFYKEYIRELLGNKHQIIDGNLGTAKHLKAQLENMDLNLNTRNIGEIEFINSQIVDNNTKVIKVDLSKKLFEKII